MARGYDTHRLLIDGKTLKALVVDCSHPEILTEIFRLVREMVFGRTTQEEFDAYCNAQPCLLWQPETPTQIQVRIKRERETVPISPSRIVWTTTHITGGPLRGNEEVQHLCGCNGQASSHFGVCLNPAHFIRGNKDTRKELMKVRGILRARGLMKIAVNQ